jgi:hypothetical protein
MVWTRNKAQFCKSGELRGVTVQRYPGMLIL